MEYLTVRETAEKWNISPRLVQQFCIAGRIPGAQKFGTAWAPRPRKSPRTPGLSRNRRRPPPPACRTAPTSCP